jgi:hypothetical protein
MKEFGFKKYSFLSFVVGTALLLCIYSCKKGGDTDENNGGSGNANSTLTIMLSHAFGGQPVQYGVDYITAAQDTIRITDLVYYFTNIKLMKDDGSVVAPETYFLVNIDDPATSTIKLTNFPKASYTKLFFTLGVDSAHNHKSGQSGALDPQYGMYWPWKSEYIFYRLQGDIGVAKQPFSFDLGGDGNTMNYEFSAAISLEQDRTVNLKMDIKELFQNPNTYNLKTDDRNIHSTSPAGLPKLIQNSTDMMSVISIQ